MKFQAVHFNPKEILAGFYSIQEIVGYAAMKTYSTQNINAYFVMTRGQTQSTGTSVLEVHGHSKPLDPNLKPEKDNTLKKHVFTPSVSPAISKDIPSTSGPQTSVPRAIPPVQSPIKYTPPISQQVQETPRKIPQISQARVAAGSSGSFTPAGGGPTPSKEVITPIVGSTSTHIPQAHTHSALQPSRMRSVTRGVELDGPKFDLDDDSQGFTQIPLLGNEPDFRHLSFKAPQQAIAKPATLRDLRGGSLPRS